MSKFGLGNSQPSQSTSLLCLKTHQLYVNANLNTVAAVFCGEEFIAAYPAEDRIVKNRHYKYVGPKEILEIATNQPTGIALDSKACVEKWLRGHETEIRDDGMYVMTFTLMPNGEFRIAPRRSEHVACASGGPVLSAGEVVFDSKLNIKEISNQSTGFCPEPISWNEVETALDRIGIQHPREFTTAVVFRLCQQCGQRNIVKDDWFVCGICESELSRDWNFERTQVAKRTANRD